ncbi:hypothetical protein PF010_g23104 [Phytophthora fragariae]|uniref:Uncharacterized protein n=1 Tax=Phytophthora fragariae TaxID=53985 RepID=A0A6G0K7D8_9STRA|nr:hypothetical protein PF010_g23104 [Phytophthora fragariae]
MTASREELAVMARGFQRSAAVPQFYIRRGITRTEGQAGGASTDFDCATGMQVYDCIGCRASESSSTMRMRAEENGCCIK